MLLRRRVDSDEGLWLSPNLGEGLSFPSARAKHVHKHVHIYWSLLCINFLKRSGHISSTTNSITASVSILYFIFEIRQHNSEFETACHLCALLLSADHLALISEDNMYSVMS